MQNTSYKSFETKGPNALSTQKQSSDHLLYQTGDRTTSRSLWAVYTCSTASLQQKVMEGRIRHQDADRWIHQLRQLIAEIAADSRPDLYDLIGRFKPDILPNSVSNAEESRFALSLKTTPLNTTLCVDQDMPLVLILDMMERALAVASQVSQGEYGTFAITHAHITGVRFYN